MRKRSTGSSLKPCSFKSANIQMKLWSRQSLCLSACKGETSTMAKAGSLWILAPGGKFLLHLNACSYEIASSPSADENLGVLLNGASLSAESEPLRDTGWGGEAASVSSGRLQRTEDTIFQPSLSSREVYFLPGAHSQEVVKRLLWLVWLLDYYPLFLFKSAPVILPGEGWKVSNLTTLLWRSWSRTGSCLPDPDSERDGKTLEVKSLHNWLWQQCFGFYDHAAIFEDWQLHVRDRIHLTKWGENIFAKGWPIWKDF